MAGPYRTRRLDGDRRAEVNLSEQLVSAFAEATESDPLAMRPLYEVVDPDALDRLFASKSDETVRPGGKIEFSMDDCLVQIVVEWGDVSLEISDCSES